MSRLWKDIRTDIPDWIIKPAESSAQDFWKYLFFLKHKKIAERMQLKPADIPKQWKTLSRDEALENLNMLFKT